MANRYQVPIVGQAGKIPEMARFTEPLTLPNGLVIKQASFKGWALTSQGLPTGWAHCEIDLGDTQTTIAVPPDKIDCVYRTADFPRPI